MLNPLSMVGNGSNVRVSPEYSNAAPSPPISRSYRQPSNGITPSNSRCSAPEIATSEEIPLSQQLVNAVGNYSFHKDPSMLQPYIYDSLDPVGYPYQEDAINAQTAPQARTFDPLYKDSLTGSPANYMQAIPGGPKTRIPLSVEARFQTLVQNNPASAGEESSVPPLIMGYPSFSPTFHPENNLHGIGIQHVLGSEDFEQIYTPNKARKHLVGVPSPSLPAQKNLPNTHQPWSSFTDESSSQQGSTLGPEASPTPNSNPHRRKRSRAVTEQRNDPQEAMSQILDSHMVPTNPPKRRRYTEKERCRVAHVRRMKACPSCRGKHQKCNHVPDANPDSHPLTPESNGPVTPASDPWGAVQVVIPSPGLHTGV